MSCWPQAIAACAGLEISLAAGTNGDFGQVQIHRDGFSNVFCERENREYGTGGSRYSLLFAAGFYFDRWLHRPLILIHVRGASWGALVIKLIIDGDLWFTALVRGAVYCHRRLSTKDEHGWGEYKFDRVDGALL